MLTLFGHRPTGTLAKWIGQECFYQLKCHQLVKYGRYAHTCAHVTDCVFEDVLASRCALKVLFIIIVIFRMNCKIFISCHLVAIMNMLVQKSTAESQVECYSAQSPMQHTIQNQCSMHRTDRSKNLCSGKEIGEPTCFKQFGLFLAFVQSCGQKWSWISQHSKSCRESLTVAAVKTRKDIFCFAQGLVNTNSSSFNTPRLDCTTTSQTVPA